MAWINVETQPQPYSIVVLILVLAIFISGVAVVYTVNQSRELYGYYYRLQLLSQKHQDEHARLLLQSSSDTTAHKILQPSLKSLNMLVPSINNSLYLP